MRNITLVFTIWISSHVNVTITHNIGFDAYDTACRLFDKLDDGTFVNPDDVISRVADLIDECSANPYDAFGGSVDYEYREMSGEEYTDTLIIDCEIA